MKSHSHSWNRRKGGPGGRAKAAKARAKHTTARQMVFGEEPPSERELHEAFEKSAGGIGDGFLSEITTHGATEIPDRVGVPAGLSSPGHRGR